MCLPMNGLNTPDETQSYEENEKVRYVIFSILSKTKLTKVISFNIALEV